MKDLPDRLKDPKVFALIERKLAGMLKADHTHEVPSEYVKCFVCQHKRALRLKKLKALGFKSNIQYLEWKRVMQFIKNNIHIDAKTKKGSLKKKDTSSSKPTQ